ncbi:GntR family transcriptional regulator, partial [Streptomyces sp. DJ]
MLFSKALKAFGGIADKGCVNTLAQTMMNAGRSADAGLPASAGTDRRPRPEGAPG